MTDPIGSAAPPAMLPETPTIAPSASAPAPNTLSTPKVDAIRAACERRDIPALVALAESPGGFLDDELRVVAWPILLGCDDEADDSLDGWKELPRHRDEEQVRLDVDRSFVYYPGDRSPTARDALKSELSALITSVLRTHPRLHYFQGYHDIASVLLLTLGPGAPSARALARLSLLRVRDFMLPSLAPALAHLRLLPPLLERAAPRLAKATKTLSTAAYGQPWRDDGPPSQGGPQQQPTYALAATLTLFAHVVPSRAPLARLFDHLLAAPAAAPLYVFAAAVAAAEEGLLRLLEQEEGDADALHAAMTRVPLALVGADDGAAAAPTANGSAPSNGNASSGSSASLDGAEKAGEADTVEAEDEKQDVEKSTPMDTAILTATALHASHPPLTLLPAPSMAIFPTYPSNTIPALSTLRTAALGAPAVSTQSLAQAEEWLEQQARRAATEEARAKALARVRSLCAAPARRWRLWRRRRLVLQRQHQRLRARGPSAAGGAGRTLLLGGGVLAAVAVAGVALALARGGSVGDAAGWLRWASLWAGRGDL